MALTVDRENFLYAPLIIFWIFCFAASAIGNQRKLAIFVWPVNIIRIWGQKVSDAQSQITMMVLFNFGRYGSVFTIEVTITGQAFRSSLHYLFMKKSVPERTFSEQLPGYFKCLKNWQNMTFTHFGNKKQRNKLFSF